MSSLILLDIHICMCVCVCIKLIKLNISSNLFQFSANKQKVIVHSLVFGYSNGKIDVQEDSIFNACVPGHPTK